MERRGPWEVRERLGAGGMGEVWAVEHATARVPGALKRPVATTPELAATLLHELRRVASLDHPGVVEVLDHGADPEPWVVFERVDGGPLSPPGSFAELRRALTEVLDALAHTHARGVLHRDLKPANLLRGRDGRIRLADFGIARVRDTAADQGSDSVGTLAFMAPEQILGEARDQGPPTDLYALACTAWLLVTGQPPFPDDPIAGHLGGTPPALEAGIAVPDGFEAWLLRGLRKSPHERFRSAAEASLALAALPDPAGVPPAPASRAIVAPTIPLPRPIAPPSRAAPPRFRSRREPAPIEVVPLPDDWREGHRPPRVLGVASSLVGVRPPALVGRAEEQGALWELAKGTGPRLALVVGPEGSGRSRLAGWLCDRVEECGGLVARTDAELGARGWVTALTGAAGLGAAPAAERIGRLAPTLDPDTVASLARWVVEGDPERPTAGPLARLVSALAGGRPMVLAWDEPGETGGRWMAALARAELPALVLGAGEAAAVPEAARIVLGPLPERARRSLVRELIDADDALAARIDARTGGHPLFAVQLIVSWAARGLLRPGPSGLCVEAGAEAADELGAVWGHRIEPLATDRNAEAILVLAALLGDTVVPAELAAACARAELPAPDAILARAREVGVLRGPPERGHWDHALLREHLTSRCRADRPRLHGAAADALSARGAAADRVARHLLGAGRTAEALPWLERAASSAGRGIDQGRAQDLCERWSAALDELGVAPWAPERAPQVLRRIGVETDTGRVSQALARADEALRAAVGWPPRVLAELHLLRAGLLERQGRNAQALEACEESRRIGGDGTRTFLTTAGVLVNCGRVEEAVERVDRGLATGPDPYQRGELLRVRAGAHMRRGRLAEAARDYEDGRAAYLEVRATRSAAMMEAESATVHHVRGDWARAAEAYRAALARIDDPGDPASWNAMVNLATVLVLSGQAAEALSWVERVLPRTRAAGYLNAELFAVAARWATQPAGPTWDADASTVESLHAASGVEDPDLEQLARLAARDVDPPRAARALAFADARRSALR